MNRQDLERDTLRYIAQQIERGNTGWAKPAGVEKLFTAETRPAPSVPQNPVNPVGSQSSQNFAVSPPPGNVQEKETRLEKTTASDNQGAPEPFMGLKMQGDIENPYPDLKTLEIFSEAIHNCIRCPLGETRTKFVFGTGDINADLVLVGEAPGREEDLSGEPFVGRAGKLLDKILAAIDLKRGENVYICNILKCRPPNNRDPQPNEVEKCEPYLVKQLQLLQPKLILALGRISAQTLLRTKDSLTRLRGKVHDYHGVPLMVTYHPAALLRNPHWKKPTWEDVQQVRKMLDEFSNE